MRDSDNSLRNIRDWKANKLLKYQKDKVICSSSSAESYENAEQNNFEQKFSLLMNRKLIKGLPIKKTDKLKILLEFENGDQFDPF